jgi:hypothetical protein
MGAFYKLDPAVRRDVHLRMEPHMSLFIEIPEPLAGRVAQAAKSQGRAPQELIIEAITNKLDPFARVDARMAPVYDRLQALGITEDEAVEDFEAEKHAMRREQEATGR